MLKRAGAALMKLIQQLILLGIFTAFMASIGFTQGPPLLTKFPSGKISTEQWKDLLRDVASKPGVRRVEDDVVTRFESASDRTIYFFSKPGHPAHPCVVIRAVVDDGQQVQVRTVGHFAGSQEAFDQWYRAFLASDERIRP